MLTTFLGRSCSAFSVTSSATTRRRSISSTPRAFLPPQQQQQQRQQISSSADYHPFNKRQQQQRWRVIRSASTTTSSAAAVSPCNNNTAQQKVTTTTISRHSAKMESIKQSEKMFYDDDEDEILVANAEDLPRGFKDGFAIVHSFEVKEATPDQWTTFLNSKEETAIAKDVTRLQLSPNNLSLPIALILLDPNKFETVSRARKFCRHGRVVLHRGPLGINKTTGERTVWIQENTHMGKVNTRVYPGDVIGRQVAVGRGFYSARQVKKAPPFDLPVVYEDDHFAIVNKPAGVVVYSPKNSGQGLLTVKSALPHVLEPPTRGTISALKRPKSVHRLDRPTSGALVVGKTLPAMDHLSTQFRERRIKKTYTAILNGIPYENPNKTISSRVAHDEWGVDVDPTNSVDDSWQLIDRPLDDKEAVTVWRTVKQVRSIQARDNTMSLVEIKPKTGRFHQIRRHMAWVCDRPIVGDKEYDGNHEGAVKLRGRGLFLCSNRVVLEHPFYNTRAGRQVWDKKFQKESDRIFPGGQLWVREDDDTVMVTASVELPTKFTSTMDRSDAVFEEYGTCYDNDDDHDDDGADDDENQDDDDDD